MDRTHAVEPAKSAFAIKSQLRRAIEAEGIPYTYVVTGCFSGYFLPSLAQPGATAPPRDKAIIMGDGTPKGKNMTNSNTDLDSKKFKFGILFEQFYKNKLHLYNRKLHLFNFRITKVIQNPIMYYKCNSFL